MSTCYPFSVSIRLGRYTTTAAPQSYDDLPAGLLLYGRNAGGCTTTDATTCRRYCDSSPSCVAYETGDAYALQMHGYNCCIETTGVEACFASLTVTSTLSVCQCMVYPGPGAPARWQQTRDQGSKS